MGFLGAAVGLGLLGGTAMKGNPTWLVILGFALFNPTRLRAWRLRASQSSASPEAATDLVSGERWALVTGGSRGIGRAVALELAKTDWNVGIVHLRNDDAARSARS